MHRLWRYIVSMPRYQVVHPSEAAASFGWRGSWDGPGWHQGSLMGIGQGRELKVPMRPMYQKSAAQGRASALGVPLKSAERRLPYLLPAAIWPKWPPLSLDWPWKWLCQHAPVAQCVPPCKARGAATNGSYPLNTRHPLSIRLQACFALPSSSPRIPLHHLLQLRLLWSPSDAGGLILLSFSPPFFLVAPLSLDSSSLRYTPSRGLLPGPAVPVLLFFRPSPHPVVWPSFASFDTNRFF